MRILLAEDDRMIGENIQIALNGENIAVDWVRDGLAADNALNLHAFDALLLDLGLPGKDGIDILRDMRGRGDRTPVLVLTARDTVPQRVLGLKSGADDYLVKPFDLEELIARLHALVRRARGSDILYRNGEVTVNLETRQVFLAGQQVGLSAREWEVLEALLTRPGAILSRSQLESRLYGWSGEVESNAVEVYVHGLRKKLGQHFVLNVRGLGYMIGKA
jgi:DNA-binding response OmpR family regulator